MMQAEGKRFFTTGEVAKILGVSTTTVIRRFDAGHLSGRRHPVTGRRMIAYESVVRFMEEHRLPLSGLKGKEQRVLALLPRKEEAECFRSAFFDDPRFALRCLRDGAEVCGAAVQWRPDLVVIDVEAGDAPGPYLVRSLRNLPNARSMVILLAGPAHRAPGETALRRLGAEGYLVKPWQPDALRERVADVLGLGALPKGRPPIADRRRWPRFRADWPAAFRVRRRGRAAAPQGGTAVVRDVSQGGAYLEDIRMHRGGLPLAPFTLHIRVTGGEGKGLKATCRPIRIHTNEGLGLGVAFLNLGSSQTERLAAALDALNRRLGTDWDLGGSGKRS